MDALFLLPLSLQAIIRYLEVDDSLCHIHTDGHGDSMTDPGLTAEAVNICLFECT